ncbi:MULTISPECIES: ABC transporter ATP-binding protein [unclassified Exiguobacterium]|uniref:ABC transporter ATP-binding protein n=1 Tax=unclassified Exiguobacterium TaxID=2644629 RepID=UPI00103DB29A|nr:MULTISPECIES: ABC transporter ATP-binding protein [unclassified Exiguobacterium]TCI73609.1 ABC transporter ATP-binding protein [Exiguobacterium sp. IPCI3]TCI82766.1 ABC transporter ATP-binding protein [Exiguobacterium sp. IPCH1]TCI83820.1 ABC transporter ATP-binding protein [Exiguobacterium sp. IPBC4]
MLTVQQLSKTIDRQQVLEDIDFTVDSGEIIALVGRNGAGKTTLLRTMVGIIRPDKGDVRYGPSSIFEKAELKRDVIFVPDSADALKHYTINEAAALYESIYPSFNRSIFRETLTRYNIDNKKIRQLSKGQKAMVTLSFAFAVQAKYYLLDEPTDGLDVVAKSDVLKLMIAQVEARNCSIIVSSHQLHELERIADRIIMIEKGRVKAIMSLEEARETSVKLQVVFNDQVPVELLERKDIEIINVTGRVALFMAKERTKELDTFVDAHDPMLVEEIPMSLEDIFRVQLGGEASVF